ncbi:MAG: hypothetical protein PHN31_02255 [Candidatus Gracilibacteria bacterium]|nr:hypothetical protein [Candidatus Gracilibacteria bacterium]
MQIYEDQFMVLSNKNNIIKLTWKKETKNLDNDLFKNEALKYIEIF